MTPLVLATLALFAPRLVAEGQGLKPVVDAVAAGDFQTALAAVDAETNALARDQGRVYVLHHAGDLDGALRAAIAANAAHPEDPWLAERRAYIASTLRRVDDAAAGVASLEANVRALSTEERQRWEDSIRPTRLEVERLRTLHEDVATARARARGTALAGLALGVVALLLATRSARAST